MKKAFLVGSLVVALLGHAPRAHAQKTGNTEQAVAALEGQWLKAQKDSNPDLLEPLLAEGFVNTSSDGKVSNKQETLALVKGTKLESAEYKDVKVTVFGSTAIATGVFAGKHTDNSGQKVTEKEQWTDTWVKMPNGKWQCVASHASPIKP